MLLHHRSEVCDHRATGLEPLERRIIFFLELPIDFVDRKDDSAARSCIHLRPDRETRRADSIETGRECRWSRGCKPLSSLSYQFETAVVALDFRKMFDSDLQIIRDTAGSDVLTVEVFDNEVCAKRASA